MKWTTKSGKQLDIDTMGSDHIANTIYFLEKRYGKDELERKIQFVTENPSRVIMPITDLRIIEQYQYMKKTLAERKLDKNSREILEEKYPVNILSIL